MQFRVLGPLEAGDERESLALGPRKQRALLVRLLLDAGRTVSVERLLDDLWGDDLPGTAVKMVQIYVSGLRKVVGTGRLLTQPSGYRLELCPGDELDLHAFERLAGAARAALAQGDPVTAADRLDEALALWRGPALGEFASEPFAPAEADRLEGMRLAAVEDRIEARLALGRARELVGELEALTAQHPLRERPREQLMLALYRSGRQGDALAAYRDFRAVLDEQLGLDPSPRLRALEQAILVHDPAVDVPARVRNGAPATVDAPPGRAAELRTLRAALDAAARGSRRLVLVSGEPGIGKSTLVEALLGGTRDALAVRGHCVQQDGPGEAYLPLLDGLGRAVEDPRVAATLAARAPSWLGEFPTLTTEAPEERARGATRERMLREMVETLEALAVAQPLIVVIEQLQWADPSTRELLRALMRRRHPARLLVLATSVGAEPLVTELSLRSTAQELALQPLSPTDAAAAFGVDAAAAAELVRRGGGNPLFMQHLAEQLRTTGSLQGVPETLRAAVRAQLTEQRGADLDLLDAAAVEGLQFTAAGVSAAVGRTVGGIDAPGVIEPRGTAKWPDGTQTAVFAFTHALFRDVLLEAIPPARLAELHRRLGERLEAAFGPDGERAHAIATHFVAGGQPAPAVRFLRLAARRCVSRRAYDEAIGHLEQALDAARELPEGPVRQRMETELLSDLGQAYVGVDGWSSTDAVACLERARATAEALPDREPLAAVQLALATLYEVRGEPATALEAVSAGGAAAAQGVQGAELLACALFHQGAFTRALAHADRGVIGTGGEPEGHYDTFPATFGDNATVACHDWAALSLWFLGRAAESLERARHALELAEQPARAYSRATARAQMATLHACRGEPAETRRWAEATVDAARERGFAYRLAMGRVLRGWAQAAAGEPDAIQEIVSGLRASRATGAHLEDPLYLGLLADAHLRTGRPGAGLEAVDEALEIAARERAHYYDAELLRLRGELLLAAGRAAAEAETAVRTGLAVAREQGARSLELRAALALAPVLARDDRAAEARRLVTSALEPLRDEDTPDVRAATALLAGTGEARQGVFERRRITVVAWELDGVGDLARDLEPERLAGLVRACHAAARATAVGEDGHVATEDESGGLLYFGYPRALEDGPIRAVRAGRRLAEAVATAVSGLPLAVRVGMDTGVAAVGRVGESALAIGETPQSAWRLAMQAHPGDVVVSEATRSSCEGYFSFSASGAGHRVTGETSARSRVEARGELSPLIGRRRELDLLVGRWEQATHGLGQAVFLTGEAGIGKSRLLRELAAGLDPAAATFLEFQCSDARTGSALHPVIDHFRRRLTDSSGGIEALLAQAGVPEPEAAPVVAALVGLPGAARLEPEALKRRTADVVVSYVLAHAARRPVVAAVEDLHWADPSTLELIEELLEAIPEARVLLVATFRPGLRLPWEPHSHVSHLSLSPCTPAEAEQLVAHAAPTPLAPEVAHTVVERSDGVPLFLEELARAAAPGETEVPATLDDLFMARLDALGPAAKAIAQVGALIGREFGRDLLVAASDLPERELDRGLDQLLAAEIVRRRGRGVPVRFAFRHALVQEAVRHSLSDRGRRSLHLRIARALERTAPDHVRVEPDTVALHLEAADEPGRAVSYRLDAGRLALSRSANIEAVDQLTGAIADLGAYADHESRADIELDARILLGNALISVRGYASPEVEACYGRARELCRRTGDDARLLPVLYGLWVNAFVRARHERALAVGLELRELAERRDPGVLLVAERAVGWPLVCMGRFAEAREHLDRIPALQESADGRPLRYLYGQDPAVAGLATSAWALWGCGEGEAADARAEEAIALARRTEHPLTMAYALGTGALVAALQRDARAARVRAAEAVAVAGEYRLPLWRAWSLYALGWAELAEGDAEGAASTLRSALSAARATGAVLFEPFALTELAEAEARTGRVEEALGCLAAAEDVARQSGEVFWQLETGRVHDRLAALRT
ncbi:MAG TPA: BTAD domain-containing putative transcriptional regulator [Solirubrobacteraceae bacterium]